MNVYTENSLVEAINELAAAEIGHLKHEVKISLDENDVPASVKDSLYLIAREALTNIRLHAMATKAMIVIDTSSKRTSLFIQDDGRGLCVEDIQKKKEGLTRIQKHVSDLGGTYEMDTNQGSGVAHWVYIPLPPVKPDQARLEMKISLGWLATLAPHPSVGCVAPNNGKTSNNSGSR